MTRNTVITAASAAIVLCCAIFFTVSRLFAGSGEVASEAQQSCEDAQEVQAQARHPRASRSRAASKSTSLADMLLTVPSNAAGVIFRHDAAEIADGCLGSGRAASLLDSVRCCFAGSSALLSYFYLGSAVPLLALDAGSLSEENLAKMQHLSETASSYGFASGRIDVPSGKTKRPVLLICPAKDLVASAERHFTESVSILDASGFRDALKQAGDDCDFVIFNAGSFGALPTGGLLEKYFTRRQLNSFTVSYCDWLILRRTADGYSVGHICRGDHSAYARVLADTPDGESRIADILPDDAVFVLDLPISDIGKSLDLRRSNLDACARLATYKDSLKVFSRRCGINPETWARELGIREVVRVRWPGGEVLLVRSAKKQEVTGPGACNTANWLSVLFGKAFSLKDENCSACAGEWTVTGSASSVTAFLTAQRTSGEPAPWPATDASCIIKCPECTIVCGESGIKIELY